MAAFGSALNPPTHPPPPLREQPFGGPKIPPATLRERSQNFKTRKRLFHTAKPPISCHEVFWAPQGRPLEDPTEIPPRLSAAALWRQAPKIEEKLAQPGLLMDLC